MRLRLQFVQLSGVKAKSKDMEPKILDTGNGGSNVDASLESTSETQPADNGSREMDKTRNGDMSMPSDQDAAADNIIDPNANVKGCGSIDPKDEHAELKVSGSMNKKDEHAKLKRSGSISQKDESRLIGMIQR